MNDSVYHLIEHSSLYIALVSLSMVLTASFLLSTPPNLSLLIAFLVAFAVYGFNKITDLAEDQESHPSRANFIKNHENSIKSAILIAYLAALGVAFLKGGIAPLIISLIPAVTGFIYSHSHGLGNFTSSHRFKEIFIVNTTVVALGWAVFVTYLPLSFTTLSVTTTSVVVATFFFLRVFITTEAFNIRDIKGDRKEGIETLPVKMGVNKTQYILHTVNIISFTLLFLAERFNMLPSNSFLLLAPILIYSLIYTNLLDKDINLEHLCIFIDGEYILMGVLVSL